MVSAPYKDNPVEELQNRYLKFFWIRNTPGGNALIFSPSEIPHLLKLLLGLVSRDTAAALGPKKVIVLKVRVQKEVQYNRLLELELGWFWFTSVKTLWEGANLQAGPRKLHFSKEFTAFKFFLMQAVGQSLHCSDAQQRVTRLMSQAKWKKFWMGSHGRSHSLAS